MTTRHTDSHAVEEYLEAIHRFAQDKSNLSTGGLAEYLEVKPASVTGMLKRLAESGLITYRRYGEVTLTEEGERQAHTLVKRHRLAERLLVDVLKVPLEQAHAQACQLEHGVSPEIEAHLETALGSPDSCPHGHPIEADTRDRTLPLSKAPLDKKLVIARLEDESPEVVQYFAERNLLPGAVITLRKWESLGDVLVLESGGEKHSLSANLARSLRVKK